ncbi:NmrA family NAD(P)-binding protein [Bdellovibrio bacteriovorus]|uniref:Nucleoside-diphosphate sugar epimerase n=1 Tax=Bdellovibrio bacteriovorus TaxID=959 RepID=A0A150WG77_BDEBC|nr:NmrA family NAD(P)-binding protein [Bdellovibrio bacteriovorus]KYG62127.1 nucleoside-diphosphate sugar epimerase [Bdellovibrio bacteriovorus]
MILVMGATGNIGSKIVTHLLAHGQKVRCVARHFPNKENFQGAELAQGDANNVSFLMDAMRGCSAIFTMIPPNPKAEESRFYQNKFGEVIAEAIEEAGIKKVVNLSSVGADLESGTGPILGLHDQEERLGEITHADIMHLRCTYFMENLNNNISSLIGMNRFFGTINGDVPIPMVATRDIAARAAFLLMNPDFKSHNVEYLLGERDISMNEAVKILGAAVGRPDAEYVEVPPQEMRNYYIGAGLSEDWADVYLEMEDAFGNGTIAGTFQRNKINTTATSIEEFARTTFADAYNKALAKQNQVRFQQTQRGGEARP